MVIFSHILSLKLYIKLLKEFFASTVIFSVFSSRNGATIYLNITFQEIPNVKFHVPTLIITYNKKMLSTNSVGDFIYF